MKAVSTRLTGRVALTMTLVWGGAICALGQAAGSANRSKSFGSESCGRADPAYIQTANETGGVPMFLQRSEAGKAFQLVRESTRENVSTVLWANAALYGRAQTFEIPVDSVTQRITFIFSVDTKGDKLVLREPSGQIVTGNSANVEDTELNCGRIVTVALPDAGEWRAEIQGTGTFWLQAEAQSEIYLVKAEFVKLGGRPGHEGLFRIQGQPLAGSPTTMQASLSAKETLTAEFLFVTQRGDSIEKLHLKPNNTDRELLEFTGSVALPNVPFRLVVTGRDLKGRRYQRFYGPLFHAETVEVSPKVDFDELAAGDAKEALFAVRNLGAVRSFKVTVTDARGFVNRVEPKELLLGAGQWVNVHVGLSVPAGTASGVGDDLVVYVASTSGQTTSNASVVHLTVGGGQGRR